MVRVLCPAVLVGLAGCVAPGSGAMPQSRHVGLAEGSPVSAGTPVDGSPLPRELNKINWPTYRIETPDLLLINALRVIPLPGYKIEPFDALLVVVANAPPAAPIRDVYPVDPDGTINF